MDLFEYQGKELLRKFDVPALEDAGIQAIFTPGIPTKQIIDWVNDNVVKESTS